MQGIFLADISHKLTRSGQEKTGKMLLGLMKKIWWVRILHNNDLGDFFLYTLGLFIPTEHHLNSTAYPSIVDDHVFYDHIASILRWLLTAEICIISEIEHLWDVVEWKINAQPKNLHQLCDSIMLIWTKTLRNFSSTLLNLCHEELMHSKGKRGTNLVLAKRN